MKWNTRIKMATLSGLLVFGMSGVSLAARDSEVAYVEEITVFPDGTQQVQGYEPQPEQAPSARPTVARGLSSVEKQELDRLEDDYAHGRIGQGEYFARRNEILRALGGDEQPNLLGAGFEF